MNHPATAIILAAGAGRRLGELGRSTSKAMVPLLGRPLIQWVWQRLTAAGAQRLVVVAHSSDSQLQDFVRELAPEIHIVLQSERRGIADAVLQALPAVGDEAYLACACDSLFDVADIARLIEAGRATPSAAVVAVQEMGVEATAARSAVEVREGVVLRLLEKPAAGTTTSPLVALPLYWLPTAVTPHLRDAALVGGERHVSTALNQFITGGGQVEAITVEHRIEVTTAADIALAESSLRSIEM
jgi:dTDP-glucose pyrophosphorylase